MKLLDAKKGVYVIWTPYPDNPIGHFHQIIAGAMYEKQTVRLNNINREVALNEIRPATLDEIKKGRGY